MPLLIHLQIEPEPSPNQSWTAPNAASNKIRRVRRGVFYRDATSDGGDRKHFVLVELLDLCTVGVLESVGP